MAKRSVNLNGLDEKIDIIHGDIKTASLNFGAAVFDAVTTNPPYMNDNHGIKNPERKLKTFKDTGAFLYGTPPVQNDRDNLYIS